MKQTDIGKPTLLLVEDEYTHYMIIKTYFKNMFNCICARNGYEALKMTESTAFDIVLMDIDLDDEKLDGITVMKKIKQNKLFKGIKIFAVTSYAMPGDREFFLREGFDGYMSKPIVLTELRDMICNAIGVKS